MLKDWTEWDEGDVPMGMSTIRQAPAAKEAMAVVTGRGSDLCSEPPFRLRHISIGDVQALLPMPYLVSWRFLSSASTPSLAAVDPKRERGPCSSAKPTPS